jgi:hypothetical protein
MFSLSVLLLCSWTMFTTSVEADQVVYLDRFGLRMADSGDIMYEPLFNPKSVNASIDEKVTFVARLEDITTLEVRFVHKLVLTSRIFIHFYGLSEKWIIRIRVLLPIVSLGQEKLI